MGGILEQEGVDLKLGCQVKGIEKTDGGLKVKVSGKRELKEIIIDPQVVDPEDIEMLQDLIMAAVNEALRKGEETREATMGKLTPGMGGMF